MKFEAGTILVLNDARARKKNTVFTMRLENGTSAIAFDVWWLSIYHLEQGQVPTVSAHTDHM